MDIIIIDRQMFYQIFLYNIFLKFVCLNLWYTYKSDKAL